MIVKTFIHKIVASFFNLQHVRPDAIEACLMQFGDQILKKI